MLVHRLRRWPNINPTLAQRPVSTWMPTGLKENMRTDPVKCWTHLSSGEQNVWERTHTLSTQSTYGGFEIVDLYINVAAHDTASILSWACGKEYSVFSTRILAGRFLINIPGIWAMCAVDYAGMHCGLHLEKYRFLTQITDTGNEMSV